MAAEAPLGVVLAKAQKTGETVLQETKQSGAYNRCQLLEMIVDYEEKQNRVESVF